jgi:hypothetical protein
MGSKIKAIETVDYSRSEGQHVLAGDIRDPQAVGPMSQSILKMDQNDRSMIQAPISSL